MAKSRPPAGRPPGRRGRSATGPAPSGYKGGNYKVPRKTSSGCLVWIAAPVLAAVATVADLIHKALS